MRTRSRSAPTTFAHDPGNFRAYESAYGRTKIPSVSIDGNIAHVDLTGGKVTSLTFVDAADEWRVLIGVQ